MKRMRPRRRRAVVWVTVALGVVMPGAARAQPCDVRAADWSIDEGTIVLTEVEATCGGVSLSAPQGRRIGSGLEAISARLVTPEGSLEAEWLRIDDAGITATAACLGPGPSQPSRPTCCSANATRSEPGRWVLEDATCRDDDGLTWEGERVEWTVEGLTVEAGRSGVPMSLGLGDRRLDAGGRAPGISSPALGYREDRQAATARVDWFQPLGAASDARIGVFGETTGAVGLAPGLRWSRPAPGHNTLDGMVAYDPTRARRARGAIEAGGAVPRLPSGLGLSASGRLHTDGTVGRDFGVDTLARERADRHLAVTAWAGGAFDRLWLSVAQRQVASPATARPEDTPVPGHLGSTPAIGWIARLPLQELGELDASLRFDRLTDSALSEPANELRLLTGGRLDALSLPALTVQPGVWLEVESRFADPESTASDFRDFQTRVVATVDLSSPWLGAFDRAMHLVEVRARGWFEAFEARDTQGTVGAVTTVSSEPAPIRLMAGVNQAVSGRRWRLTLPIDWLAHFDGELSIQRLVFATRIDLAPGPWSWQVAQRGDVDLERGRLGGWSAGLSLRRGLGPEGVLPPAGEPLPAAGHLGLGGSVALTRSDIPLLPGVHLPETPFVPVRAGDEPEVGNRVGSAWLELGFSRWGLFGRASWPLQLDRDPDVTGALWLGAAQQLRLVASGGALSDGTVIAYLTLAFGGAVPPGPHAWGL